MSNIGRQGLAVSPSQSWAFLASRSRILGRQISRLPTPSAATSAAAKASGRTTRLGGIAAAERAVISLDLCIHVTANRPADIAITPAVRSKNQNKRAT